MAEASANGSSFGLVRLIIGFLQLWVLAIVLILAAAFIMGLLGANPDVPFAAWVFERSNDLMQPFVGIFDDVVLTGSTSINLSLLAAAFVYAVIGGVLNAISRRV